MPWSHRTRPLSPACLHLALDRAGRSASVADVLAAWRDDPAFCSFFDDILAAAPFTAFRWETPAVTAADLDRPFECVLLDDPDLDRPADPAAFAEHFPPDPSLSVVAFANLRADAVLVVPCPRAAPAAYVHLAAFVRSAPADQRRDLWRTVADALHRRLGSPPLWLSTAGAGVPWLHVRIDDRPKYYAHAPYRKSLR